jgi:hypothetical protein
MANINYDSWLLEIYKDEDKGERTKSRSSPFSLSSILSNLFCRYIVKK